MIIRDMEKLAADMIGVADYTLQMLDNASATAQSVELKELFIIMRSTVSNMYVKALQAQGGQGDGNLQGLRQNDNVSTGGGEGQVRKGEDLPGKA